MYAIIKVTLQRVLWPENTSNIAYVRRKMP